MDVPQILENAKTETDTNNTQWDDAILLNELNIERNKLIEEIKAHKGEQYFFSYFYTDLAANQSLYDNFYDENGVSAPFNKILNVAVKYSDNSDYSKAEAVDIGLFANDEEYYRKQGNKTRPLYMTTGNSFRIYPESNNTVVQGIKLSALMVVPDLTLSSTEADLWASRIYDTGKVLSYCIQPFMQAKARGSASNEYQVAMNRYREERQKFMSRISVVKQPIKVHLPDTSHLGA